ncbi:MAG: flagellar motor protein MotB [Candidatus Omnitrophota bacterium]|jgi:chemotaxis protein MotB
MKKRLVVLVLLGFFILPGCSYIKKAQRADELALENSNLRYKISQLKKEKAQAVEEIAEEKKRELSELEQAKLELEKSLKKEIGEYKAKLKMTERGLVITFLSEVFFDSGKNDVKEEGKLSLRKVAEVLNKDVPNSNVAVEGHTDNDPIKYSAWSSNWELSSARALAVLHYLVDECEVRPGRLSANGYGEFHPVSPNDSAENKQKNRRVEIVILPSLVSKVKAD